ncbi:TIGR04282 family arsenosugar biosynthesis glycosyltransferase [Algoriphagus marincola]|uniref:TIGR04282 family arsenosugar biosynthesis glycosyltransferase n=1 Tax=Algoriphagus marincola TaxID=264027 RepID=UPI0004153606|nr:TIGR04282 family arsenosugar biosynthesis glycosyltransferase [Algoriphagus marincola]
MERSAIIIFQKNAQLGKVKTRLAKDLGDHKALEIYDRLCKFTHRICSQVAVDKFLYYSNFVPEDKPRYGSYHFKVQTGIGLGERMSNAFSDLFSAGYQKVLIIGTDCAEINPELFLEAFETLNHRDVVIGPAEDGGYYLLGMSQYFPQLFHDVNWSTSEVIYQTKSNIKSIGISYSELAVRSDIDTLEDWQKMKSLIDELEGK